jgi:NAD(P)-dependent dehydrogenase (short-subunit alcohol dehydrogenase family)
MDLLDPVSIDAFAGRFASAGRALHLLVNSAGIMATPLTRDARGFESQFATNHLGHFHLTARLWPALQAARGARVVSVSSIGHRYSSVLFDFAAYGQSKTANILFAAGLDARAEDAGVRAFSLNPGTIAGTGLGKNIPHENLVSAGIIDPEGNPILDPARQQKTPGQGAATIVWCATSPQLDGLGGLYCENCDVAPLMPEQQGQPTIADAGRLTGVMPYAVDPANADRLWTLSEQLLGLTFLPGKAV